MCLFDCSPPDGLATLAQRLLEANTPADQAVPAMEWGRAALYLDPPAADPCLDPVPWNCRELLAEHRVDWLLCGLPADALVARARYAEAAAAAGAVFVDLLAAAPPVLFPHLFEAQARRAPTATALVAEQGHLSYGQLNAQANRLAHYLMAHGVGPHTPVALCLQRTPALLVSLLAVLKAGGAYVPLDPAYPAARLRHLLDDSAPRLVLAHAATRECLAGALVGLDPAPPVLDLDSEVQAWSTHSPENPGLQLSGLAGEHLAYVIYTSGSTGLPKGVMIEHRGLVNLAHAQTRIFAPGPTSRVLQFASYSFDASIFEIVMALAHGASLHLGPAAGPLVGEALLDLLRTQRITHATLPPMVLAGLQPGEGLSCLQTLILAGETPAQALLDVWAPGRALYNAYGPTEATVWASVQRYQPGCPPTRIGQPIANVSIHLLDEDGRPVAVGEPGEIHIGGAGVARGYLNRETLTAQRFWLYQGERCYRSGDLARYDAEGNLEFLGRNDFQVKVRGVRIELGEIESALLALPGIEQAQVIVREDRPADKRLVAYYRAPAALDAQALRHSLSLVLAEPLLPVAYVWLERLPLTANGKLDRQALPAPTAWAFASAPHVAPRGPLESTLAELWCELLGVTRVGRDDEFLALGGNSLVAVQLILRMREAFHRQLSLKQLFAARTLGRLAEVLADSPPVEHQRASFSAPALDDLEPRQAPLSYQQSAVWLLQKLSNSLAYHAQSVIHIQGQLDAQRLQRTLDDVLERHEIYRTTFHEDEQGEPFQQVHPGVGASLQCLDLSREAPDLAFAHLLEEEVHRPIDTGRLPLVRWLLVTLGPGRQALIHIEHHLVHDGWSANLFLQDLVQLYAHHQGLRPEPPPPPAVQYRQYAHWQRGPAAQQRHQALLAYWQTALDGAPHSLPLPTDFARPAQLSGRGRQVRLELPADLSARLRSFSQAEGVTLFTSLLAVFQVLLGRYCQREDFLIGSAVANRGARDLESCIGMFVNSLALRADLSGQPSFRTLLARVGQTLMDAHDHQELPFELLVRALQPDRGLSRNPLFQVGFSFHDSKVPPLAGDGFSLSLFEAYSNQTAKFDLEIVLIPRSSDPANPDGLTLLWNYSVDLFDAASMQRMSANYLNLLQQCLAHPGRAIGAYDLASPAERQRLLVEWNPMQTLVPQPSCLHRLFEAQVERDPWAPALSFDGSTLGYRELNGRANRLAHHLISLGVGPDVPVALCLERSLDLLVGLLAILKAGGAYLPLDPTYPTQRLQHMLEDGRSPVVLTHGAARPALTAALRGLSTPPRVLDLQTDATRWAERPAENPQVPGLSARNLAYIIYTSGSTGTPKGVMVEHAQVSRLFASTQTRFGFDGDDVWSLFHSIAFDFSVWEIWGAWLHGGRLLVVPQAITRAPGDFYRLLCEQGVTVLNQTPSAFRGLLAAQGDCAESHRLRHLVFGGEALETASLRPWYADPRNQDTQLVNMYGITEITVHATYRALSAADAERSGASPIGRPLDDLRCYLLDAQGQPVPIGVPGEIHIGGAGVARGYLNRPELNAERFIDNPFVAGDRLYRSGDLARYDAEGNLAFLGRNDSQVKVRGFRIELGEIEARLVECPGVREARVIVREDSPGDQRLVAYYTEAGSGADSVQQLRAHLAASLPAHMLPAAYVRLEALPLTANGKLDHQALPAPDQQAVGPRTYVAPQGALENTLAQIWSQLLGVERIGRDDHFFALGGHSLLALRVLERLRRQGIDLEARLLFSTPVLHELAALVGQGRQADAVPPNLLQPGCSAIHPDLLPLVTLDQGQIDAIVATVPGGAANVQDIYPLSPLQEGILFHHMMAQEGDPYLVWNLLGFADRALLERYVHAVRVVVGRHDILRTAVLWSDLPEPVQVVWREPGDWIEEVELDPADGDIATQLRQRYDPRHYRLPLGQAPLMRLAVAHDPQNGRWLALRLFHHIIDDNTSLKHFNAEVEAVLAGRVAQLPAPLAYRTFIAQLRRSHNREAQEAFFRGMLGTVREPTAPFGLLDTQGDGSGIREARLALDGPLAQRIRTAAQGLGVSPASLFHVAWAQVLAHTAGRPDVVFGTVLFGRLQGGEGSERIMGPFINTLPLRIDLAAEGSEACVRRTHALLTELFEHEQASLSLAQRCSGVLAPAPLFTTLLNFRHSDRLVEGRDRDGEAWQGIELLAGEERTNYPLVMAVDDQGDGFRLGAQVSAALQPERLCAMMQRALETLTEALEGRPQQRPDRLDVLPAAERQRLLLDWNRGGEPLPPPQCLHRRFEAQVARDPQATALVFQHERLSYGELNTAANRLAHHLRTLGVGPDVRVALCFETGVSMLVGLLAVLKAGGAYVPLDPSYPSARLRQLLEDSQPPLALTHPAARPALQAALAGLAQAPRLLDLETDGPAWAQSPGDNPEPWILGLTPRHLAYVIYTSGSTGTPKGVMVEHRQVSRLFDSTQARFAFDPHDVWTLFHSIAFDFSVWELWGAWLHGGRLVLVPQSVSRTPGDFYRLLCEQGVTVLNQTPSAFSGLLAAQADSLQEHRLRCLVFGGEALETTALRPWYADPRNRATQLVNMYGITEICVHATYRALSAADAEHAGTSPIGRPLDDLRCYLLDDMGQPVPIGVPGEIHIGGAGVARGYLNRPELNAQRFIDNPFVPGDRLYRSGDLARYDAEGNLAFLGRNDSQVKVRGFRIELGEIEACLAECPGVREARVVAREAAPGDVRLVAYYSEIPGDSSSVQALRERLAANLPEHMLPAAYVRLAALPLTSNGKLDRQALPVPEASAYVTRAFVAPSTPMERAVAQIWSEVLRLDQVGMTDNFFHLGGHSLLATRIVAKVEALLGVSVPLSLLFNAPTLEQMLEFIFAECEESPA
ncbi:MAG: amino acid adenylation domain-containing protein [Pseudomonas sp.]|uniref:non-ribosomal peptide synthetase n=1 Tax=Pseudomonas sp. TaxID=306 RepID=UPI0033953079